MFCSTIIPTVGRETVTRAVESVLNQTLTNAEFEIIVVNDSGQPLPQAEWQQCEQVQVITTQRRERSVARNTGAAVARGQYLHFLDDDDWLFPDAFRHLQQLANQSQAAWLYGYTQLVDRTGNPVIQLKHKLNGNSFVQVMAGEWIPLQSSLIKTQTFFAIGGFNPLISGPEDIDLLRRIALSGELAGTPHLTAYIIRGEVGSTTDYDTHPQLSRWARERILDSPGVFDRMHSSATNSYWQGRILRAYLTSAVWNMQQKCIWKATSRMIFGLTSLLTAVPHFLSPKFWQAISKPYLSETFAQGFEEVANLH